MVICDYGLHRNEKSIFLPFLRSKCDFWRNFHTKIFQLNFPLDFYFPRDFHPFHTTSNSQIVWKFTIYLFWVWYSLGFFFIFGEKWLKNSSFFVKKNENEKNISSSQHREIRSLHLYLQLWLMNFWLQPAEKQLAATTTELASNNPMRLLPIVAVLIAIVLLLVILAVIFVIIIRGRNNCTNSNR